MQNDSYRSFFVADDLSVGVVNKKITVVCIKATLRKTLCVNEVKFHSFSTSALDENL